VEAELSRLREQRDGLRWQLDDLRRQAMEMKAQGIWPVSTVVARAEAAEAQCARLQQVLQWAIDEPNLRALIRDEQAYEWWCSRIAALAGPDTPADNNEVPAGCAPRVREITEPSRTDGIGATPADSQEDKT
jgi:hypothetical protein